MLEKQLKFVAQWVSGTAAHSSPLSRWHLVVTLAAVLSAVLFRVTVAGADANELTSSKTAPPLPPDAEADSTVTLEAPMQAFHSTLCGQTNVVANIVVGAKKYPIFPLSMGAPAIRNDGVLAPLFQSDGKTNATALQDEIVQVYLELTDVLASPALSRQFYASLEDVPELIGKSWGQPRIKTTIEVSLKWLDLRNQNEARTLATCSLQRMDGKTTHKLLFTIDNETDLEALRSAHRDELFIDLTVAAYCRVKTETLIAEGATISSAVVSLTNDIRSKTGNQTTLVFATGGGLASNASMRNIIKRRIEADLMFREGHHVPSEVLNTVLDRVLTGIFQEVNLQHEDRRQLVTAIVGN